jgi:hypothetical protein
MREWEVIKAAFLFYFIIIFNANYKIKIFTFPWKSDILFYATSFSLSFRIRFYRIDALANHINAN